MQNGIVVTTQRGRSALGGGCREAVLDFEESPGARGLPNLLQGSLLAA